ncbi:MAG: helix-turn-helix domain-containing protein [Alphaproteobacteria bacterium]|nr:helix-turn-helix domain-containing protein [Alphaproteobacteria bacterium]MCL2889769.1 helix-turn-helix domain-containing protein [Alphaproteobacteria bacterium]
MAWEEVIFPNNIRNIRLSRGMKMTAVARQAGLSLSAMSKVEKGVRRLNQKQLLTLCGILDCKLSDIFIKESDQSAGYWESEMTRRLSDNENSGLKIFGTGVRTLRRKIGKTIANAAKDAKMTLSVYHKIEVGQREVYEDEIENLAHALGLNAESMFKAIAELFESGALTKQISKVEEKARAVLTPNNPAAGLSMHGALYGSKIYDSARKKLVPVFGTPGDKNIVFKKSDEKMIVMPMNLEGESGIYAVIPNIRRMGVMFPNRSYLFVNPDVVPQPGDLAIALDEDFEKLEPDTKTHARIVMVGEDAKGNLYGHMVAPDEKIPVKNTGGRLHKVVQIVIE